MSRFRSKQFAILEPLPLPFRRLGSLMISNLKMSSKSHVGTVAIEYDVFPSAYLNSTVNRT